MDFWKLDPTWDLAPGPHPFGASLIVAQTSNLTRKFLHLGLCSKTAIVVCPAPFTANTLLMIVVLPNSFRLGPPCYQEDVYRSKM